MATNNGERSYYRDVNKRLITKQKNLLLLHQTPYLKPVCDHYISMVSKMVPGTFVFLPQSTTNGHPTVIALVDNRSMGWPGDRHGVFSA
jgi:hypothetical protein